MKFKEFIKYQSLGNHFIVFDGFKKPRTFVQSMLHEADWSDFVREICNPFTGIGADGVLILTSNEQDRQPEIIIFNADGSRAQNCSNGLRCIAHHLYMHHRFPALFGIWMGNRMVQCHLEEISIQEGRSNHAITTDLGKAILRDTCSVTLESGNKIHGYCVDIGNPHFIVMEQVTPAWLTTHGKEIEHHSLFPDRTNVEYLWQTTEHPAPTFSLLVHERGVGMTQACSSGVAASLGLLVSLGIVAPQKKAIFAMPGGTVTGWMQNDGNLILQASASLVFYGTLP